MISVEWEIPLKFPDFKLDEKALREIGRAIEIDTVTNIKDQKRIDGSAIKKNSPYYAKWKRAAGYGTRSLIAKDKSLVKLKNKSFAAKTSVSERSVTVAPAAGNAADRSGWAQEKGYTEWFGISPRAVDAIQAALARFIERAWKKAAGK
jgi:hypothetical protein